MTVWLTQCLVKVIKVTKVNMIWKFYSHMRGVPIRAEFMKQQYGPHNERKPVTLSVPIHIQCLTLKSKASMMFSDYHIHTALTLIPLYQNLDQSISLIGTISLIPRREIVLELNEPPQNQQDGMCAQRRLRSAWASAQADQRLCCPHEGSLGP